MATSNKLKQGIERPPPGNVVIVGAGSAGSHHLKALQCQELEHLYKQGCIYVVDNNKENISNFKDKIYLPRYGELPDNVKLIHTEEAKKLEAFVTMTIIATPPDTHKELAALQKWSSIIVVEKPLTDLSYREFPNYIQLAVNYNHLYSPAVSAARNIMQDDKIMSALGRLQTIEVDWKESYNYIMQAHQHVDVDSYYVFDYQRGGGAGFEHSHGIAMALHLADVLDVQLTGELERVVKYDSHNSYDTAMNIHLQSACCHGVNISQDLVTSPPRKVATIHFEFGTMLLNFSRSDSDQLSVINKDWKLLAEAKFDKSREEEFRRALIAIDKEECLCDSTMGLEICSIITAAHEERTNFD
jgi:predicted dehydrogenase